MRVFKTTLLNIKAYYQAIILNNVIRAQEQEHQQKAQMQQNTEHTHVQRYIFTCLIFYIAYNRDSITNQWRKGGVWGESNEKTSLLYWKNKVRFLPHIIYNDEFQREPS